MAAAGPQGSRTGLIIAVVLMTVGFVVVTFGLIYMIADNSKLQEAAIAIQARDKQVVKDWTSPLVTELQDEKSTNRDLKDTPLLDVLQMDMGQLQQAINGQTSATQPSYAVASAAHQVIADAGALLSNPPSASNPPLPTDLMGAIKALADRVQKVDAINKGLVSQQASDVANYIKQLANETEAVTAANDKVTQLTTEMQAKEAAANALVQQQNDDERAENSKWDNVSIQLNAKNAEVANQLKSAQNDKSELVKQITELKIRIPRFNPEEMMVRRAAGHIVSVASDDVVYIDLKKGDGVEPGMTFEVFYRWDGIPPIEGDGISVEDMPEGEGSIEVRSVDSNSCMCKVLHVGPGLAMHQGDILCNLVFDRNAKLNFVVYGKFDLGGMGTATDVDRTKLEGLIRQWGGNLEKQVDVATDFVVMGKEPEVQTFSAEDLQNPATYDFHQRQVQEHDAWETVLNAAINMHIPVMNQNRFLYYVGYYEMAQQ